MEHHVPPFRSREYFLSDERREWMQRFEAGGQRPYRRARATRPSGCHGCTGCVPVGMRVGPMSFMDYNRGKYVVKKLHISHD